MKFFEENLSTNHGLIAVFVKVALKELSIAFDWFTCSHVFFFFFGNRASLLAFSWLQSVQRSFAKRMSDKNFSETSDS